MTFAGTSAGLDEPEPPPLPCLPFEASEGPSSAAAAAWLTVGIPSEVPRDAEVFSEAGEVPSPDLPLPLPLLGVGTGRAPGTESGMEGRLGVEDGDCVWGVTGVELSGVAGLCGVGVTGRMGGPEAGRPMPPPA